MKTASKKPTVQVKTIDLRTRAVWHTAIENHRHAFFNSSEPKGVTQSIISRHAKSFVIDQYFSDQTTIDEVSQWLQDAITDGTMQAIETKLWDNLGVFKQDAYTFFLLRDEVLISLATDTCKQYKKLVNECMYTHGRSFIYEDEVMTLATPSFIHWCARWAFGEYFEGVPQCYPSYIVINEGFAEAREIQISGELTGKVSPVADQLKVW